MSAEMNVIKRDGTQEPVQFDKVLERIRKAAAGLSVNYTRLAQLVIEDIQDGIRTADLDELAARISISYITTHPDWATVASRIILSNAQRSAPTTFSAAMASLTTLAPEIAAFIATNAAALDAMIEPERDFLLDYFGFKTLERGYLMRAPSGTLSETPQYMWLRVAVGIHSTTPNALVAIKETYDLMSTKAFTHATPTLFNAATKRPQLSSCYLVHMRDDSVDGIFDTLKDCAQISKYAGGIGLSVHNIRAAGSYIAGTNGRSDGLVPMLRVFNNTARYINQGGRRNGSFAIYLEPWHADVQAFLRMKTNTGSEEEKARDLFYALWIPDLFMRRVETGGDWSLFCPHEAPGLSDVHGAEFDALYDRYEATPGLARKTISAQKLWSEILISQIETGTPYLLYKDAANAKSNQKNLGTIKSSNLCVAPYTEIDVYEPEEYEWHGMGLTNKAVKKRYSIASQEGKTVQIWNGTGLSTVTVKKTGEQVRLVHVVVEQSCDGVTTVNTLDCTPYHKFILPYGDSALKHAPRVEAGNLRPGTILCNMMRADGKIVSQRVQEILPGPITDTYCFTEPINNAGVFNGILTGNCTEIMEFSSPEETAVCNLASIALPYFLLPGNTGLDFARLRQVTGVIVRNLNRIIDINFYPTPETSRSNFRHRPIGIGIQGLADVFALLKMSWESPEAIALNQEIFEHIYYAAVGASADLAITDGSYATFAGSPASQGILQPDLWGLDAAAYRTATTLDWPALRARAATGLRNSLLLAPMPTASTSQILGYNECIEPFTSNIYNRRVLAGEFTVVNQYLVRELMDLNLWTPELKDRILGANGSVQSLTEIPEDVRARYKTVWEVKQKTLIDMSADRGAFICQSQSLNLFVQDPTIARLSSMHFYAWKRGLKTGIYYLRTKSSVQAIKFTVDPALCTLCSS